MKAAGKVEFGDFQTPDSLAGEVCGLLVRLGEAPEEIIEPTAGRGAFLVAAAEAFPSAMLKGFEINRDYVVEARERVDRVAAARRTSVLCEDFFAYDWDSELGPGEKRLLLLGNPPWVTNAGVAAVNGTNLPAKENLQGLRGIAARTGKANFDISEWMLIRLLRALHGRRASMGMLCKTATARKFLRYAWKNEGHVASASIYRIDAAKHFDASVDACLLYLRTGADGPEEVDVYASLSDLHPVVRIGLECDEWVADIRGYRALRHLEGVCPFRWRSGVKHDCAAIMELHAAEDGSIETSSGARLVLEPDYIYPFLKCSDLANARTIPTRLVLVTQRFVGDDTSMIANIAPQTWAYLQRHRDRFEARKSSIYRGRVPFSLFGIGEYAFSPWKVAVSGLHRSSRFQLVGPIEGKPVFFDDACYYLSFETEEAARVILDILNSAICRQFLNTLLFPDAKRPITVDLLQRLDLAVIAHEAGLGRRWDEIRRIHYFVGEGAPQMELLMEAGPAVKTGPRRSRST
jgi:hypothetical protein